MKISLNMIREKHPCYSGWEKLLKYLSKTKADDELFEISIVLESNGIRDAIWCLRCFDYKVTCLFSADVAKSVLPIFEKRYPEDLRPRKAIEAIKLFYEGMVSKKELKATDTAAYAAAANAADAADTAADTDAADAAADTYAADAAADAAYAAAYAAYAAADAAYAAAYAAYAADAAAYAAYADTDAADAYAAYAAAAAAYAADTRKQKWEEITKIFLKHFKGEGKNG